MKRPERVILEVGEHVFDAKAIKAAADGAAAMVRWWALADATWEPHDWSDFQ